MAILITNCTNRKRYPSPPELRASDVPPGSLNEIACVWQSRVKAAQPTYVASDMYCGRAFKEAVDAASLTNAKLWIISAGLGIVAARDQVPAYDLTIAPRSNENIANNVISGWSLQNWWRAISTISSEDCRLSNLCRNNNGIIVLALSGQYLELLRDDLLALAPNVRRRLRIVTHPSNAKMIGQLNSCVIPYDERIDGPDSDIKGTRSDFAPRAAKHFMTTVLRNAREASCEDHQLAVIDALSNLRYPRRFNRTRKDDDEIVELIINKWEEVAGSSTRMLRVIRDDEYVACEQSRFKRLFRQATVKMESA